MDRTVQENQQLNALFDRMVSQRSQPPSDANIGAVIELDWAG